MLKKLRHKKTAKKIWIILAILVLPAFLLWGSGSIIRNRQTAKFAGIISGKRITMQELADSLNAVRDQAIIQFGDNFSEVQKSLNLEGQAWERLIILIEAKRRDIKATDKEVVDFIESYPFFQTKGVFDNYIYNQMLKYVFRTPPRQFEEEVRQNLMIGKLYKDVTSGIKVEDSQLKGEYRKINESISVEYVGALPSELSKNISVTEAEIKDYFKKDSFQFKVPLSFNLEYVEMPFTDKDASSQQERTKAIFKSLKKRSDLARVAKENNLNLKETGFFPETGPIPGIGWSPQVVSIISKTAPGHYLSPILIDKSFYIIRVKDRKEPYVPDFETIKNKVKEALIKEKSQALAREKIETCFNSLKKKPDFKGLAKEFGLKYGSTEPFKYDGYIEGIGASDEFWSAADKLKDTDISGIIEAPSGFFVIKLKSRQPMDEKKFEKEKSEFREKLLLQKRQEAFAGFVERLKANSRSNFTSP